MTRLKDKGIQGFEWLGGNSRFYKLYLTYYNNIMCWVKKNPEANVIGISLDSPEYIATLKEDITYNSMKGMFDE